MFPVPSDFCILQLHTYFCSRVQMAVLVMLFYHPVTLKNTSQLTRQALFELLEDLTEKQKKSLIWLSKLETTANLRKRLLRQFRFDSGSS